MHFLTQNKETFNENLEEALSLLEHLGKIILFNLPTHKINIMDPPVTKYLENEEE